MVDRGVGDHALEVGLFQRGEGAKDDTTEGKNDEAGSRVVERLGEDRPEDPEETVDAHLRHDAGEEHRSAAGLLDELAGIGFNLVGFGCTTCIGNSGPLKNEISAGVKAGDVIACSVLSGNRNFDGRVHPEVKQNYLASPPLVVAYALAGSLDLDLDTEPLGTGAGGSRFDRPVPAVPITIAGVPTVAGMPPGRKLIDVPTPHAVVSRTNSSSST